MQSWKVSFREITQSCYKDHSKALITKILKTAVLGYNSKCHVQAVLIYPIAYGD